MTGYRDYEPIAERHRIPIVVTGFEPLDLLKGVLAAVTQLERGEARVENQYARAVVREGNLAALRMIDDVFVVSDRSWRGLGEIPKSGYALAPKYAAFDAERVFDVAGHRRRRSRTSAAPASSCRAACARPTARSSARAARRSTRSGPRWSRREGACAAYFHYRRPPRETAAVS